MIDSPTTWDWQDRIVIIGDPDPVERLLHERHGDLKVVRTRSCFEGMHLAAEPGVRGIVLNVQSAGRELGSTVAGLREAGGDTKPLVICCSPGLEPAARRALTEGADDYLITPPAPGDLERALRLAPLSEPTSKNAPEDPDAYLREIDEIVEVVGTLDRGPRETLDRLAEIIARALNASWVSVVLENTYATTENRPEAPVLVQAIEENGRVLGQIRLGPRQQEAYGQRETKKLASYARLLGRVWQSVNQQAAWRAMALTDELTGMPNRRFLFRRLDELLARAQRERFRVTVLVFDIDDFKRYNDQYGHQVGDEILREAARLFRKHCRQDDLVTRYGGDEFVVVFWDADEPRVAGSQHPENALYVLRRFRKALRSHEFSSLGPHAKGTLTISGGLATFPWDAPDVQGLIRRADEALRQAKKSGKNRIFLVGPGAPSSQDSFTALSDEDRPTPDPSHADHHKEGPRSGSSNHGDG